jgi:pentatricopeptide repeat protein
LDGFVGRHGYTSIENYEEARRMFEELREEGLAHLSGAELDEFLAQSQWAQREK